MSLAEEIARLTSVDPVTRLLLCRSTMKKSKQGKKKHKMQFEGDREN